MINLSLSRPAAPRFNLLKRLSVSAALLRQRRALAQLDHTALNDIGVNPADAHVEASRPVWDVPQNWLQ